MSFTCERQYTCQYLDEFYLLSIIYLSLLNENMPVSALTILFPYHYFDKHYLLLLPCRYFDEIYCNCFPFSNLVNCILLLPCQLFDEQDL